MFNLCSVGHSVAHHVQHDHAIENLQHYFYCSIQIKCAISDVFHFHHQTHCFFFPIYHKNILIKHSAVCILPHGCYVMDGCYPFSCIFYQSPTQEFPLVLFFYLINNLFKSLFEHRVAFPQCNSFTVGRWLRRPEQTAFREADRTV